MLSRRNLSDYVRAQLTLQAKPLIEEEAKARQATSTGGANPQLSQKSDEAGKGRTDEAVAALADVSRDTVRKVEAIEQKATPELKAASAADEVVFLSAQAHGMHTTTPQSA